MLEFARDNFRFVRSNARWIGAGFLLTLFSSFGQTFFIGLSGNDLRATFHLSGRRLRRRSTWSRRWQAPRPCPGSGARST